MATAARASAPTRVRQERERALNARANAIVPLLLELNEANKDARRDEWEQQAYTRGLRGLEKSWRARQRAGQLRVVLENREWGNGAFTQALVEGIKGQADYTGKGKITINSLDLYLSERVKDLTRGRQTPTTTKPKTVPDFPIAVKL